MAVSHRKELKLVNLVETRVLTDSLLHISHFHFQKKCIYAEATSQVAANKANLSLQNIEALSVGHSIRRAHKT